MRHIIGHSNQDITHVVLLSDHPGPPTPQIFRPSSGSVSMARVVSPEATQKHNGTRFSSTMGNRNQQTMALHYVF